MKAKCKHENLSRTKANKSCYMCGAPGECAHRTIFFRCDDCGRMSLCKHGRRGDFCLPCGGRGICIHKRKRATCIPCGGSGICIHKKQRFQCVMCNGSSICVHKKQRSHCVPCMGTQICVHKKKKQSCGECNQNKKCADGNVVGPSSAQKSSGFTRISMASLLNVQKLADSPSWTSQNSGLLITASSPNFSKAVIGNSGFSGSVTRFSSHHRFPKPSSNMELFTKHHQDRLFVSSLLNRRLPPLTQKQIQTSSLRSSLLESQYKLNVELHHHNKYTLPKPTFSPNLR